MRHWLICAEDANWIIKGDSRLKAYDKFLVKAKDTPVYYIEEICEDDLDLYTEARHFDE